MKMRMFARRPALRSPTLAVMRAVGAVALVAACSGAQSPPPSPSMRRHIVVEGEDLTGIGYDVGSPTAPVVLVNFSDFGCPYCASFARETYPALAQEFVRTGRVFFKYVPFAMGSFPNGKQAARASECAADQGQFWPMHAALYDEQRIWKNTIRAAPVFAAAAGRLGLDGPAFARCYDSRRTDPRTEGASMLAQRLGVRVTPTFFVNGRRVEGALPLADFRAVLRDAGAGVAAPVGGAPAGSAPAGGAP